MVDGKKVVHFLNEEYNYMPILNDMNLTDNIEKRMDVVFFLEEQARNGRSIPPETTYKFDFFN
ncbi:hypothetical protein JL193_08080 [Polaribacter batillariae]|uniref:Uncharacterized protein n=1 Tax=Polaribacter batillariae TaxID=2808900 RepID=A0ABX7SZQ7_9FLAO|nr:hypothetical protein [Polaribacter batillariae]QTD39184.1 hypothetical protein JL193_08080 [Polaribacter batillariae]